MKFSQYDPGEFYDELYEGPGQPRPGSALLLRKFASLPEGELKKRQQAAERVILNMGMTFGVYGSDDGHEQIFPFDIVPRIVEPADWEHIESGLRQRLRALNLFIGDVYHEQKILKDGVVPGELIYSSKAFLKACCGLTPRAISGATSLESIWSASAHRPEQNRRTFHEQRAAQSCRADGARTAFKTRLTARGKVKR